MRMIEATSRSRSRTVRAPLRGTACLHRSIQVLREVDQPLDLTISDPRVRGDADGVVDEGVGGHLAAFIRAGPGFRGLDEGSPDAPSPNVGIDVPAFDVADR